MAPISDHKMVTSIITNTSSEHKEFEMSKLGLLLKKQTEVTFWEMYKIWKGLMRILQGC